MMLLAQKVSQQPIIRTLSWQSTRGLRHRFISLMRISKSILNV
jgi:hypothetical protein